LARRTFDNYTKQIRIDTVKDGKSVTVLQEAYNKTEISHPSQMLGLDIEIGDDADCL